MKHKVICMKLHDGSVHLEGTRLNMKLPDGCIGLLFVFESKKAARAYYGKDVSMHQVGFGDKPKWKKAT